MCIRDSGSPVPVPSATQSAPASKTSVPALATAPKAALGEVVSIKTDLFVADVSLLGGDLIGLELKNYKETNDKKKNFSLFDTRHQYAAQSGLIGEGLPNHKTKFTVSAGSRELEPDAKTIQLRLEAPVVEGVKVTKDVYKRQILTCQMQVIHS